MRGASGFRFLTLVSVAALFLPFSLTSSAQAPAASPVVGQTAPFAAGGEAGRITLDVLVNDKNGNPIPDLTARDFILLDNGQQRPLVSFRFVDPRKPPGALRVLIVVDMINTGFNEVSFEREQLGEFLNQDGGKLAFPTQIAIATETGMRIMPQPQLDGHALLAQFRKVATETRSIGRSAGFYGAGERLEDSLIELRQLVNYEAKQPGRKIIVFLSPGWPMLPMASVEEDQNQRNWAFNVLTHLTDGLQKGHIGLYSADPYLLGRTNPLFYRAYIKPVRRPDQAEYPTLSLQVLAEHSGGRALTMGKDVLGQLNAAMRDAGPYYELTFEPAAADKPNEYHDLQVKVDRPGAVARTNAGYYARIEPVGSGKAVKPSKAPAPSR